jgi:hypothetical protein
MGRNDFWAIFDMKQCNLVSTRLITVGKTLLLLSSTLNIKGAIYKTLAHVYQTTRCHKQDSRNNIIH